MDLKEKVYLYHATQADFSQFRLNTSSQGSGGSDHGEGIYFFHNEESAEHLLENVLTKRYKPKQKFIYIDDMPGINKDIYTQYLIEEKGFNPAITHITFNFFVERSRTIKKEELMQWLLFRRYKPKEIEPIATFLDGKNVRIAEKNVPFKGRVLRVKIADNITLWDTGKTLAENGCHYDFEKIWSLIAPCIQNNPALIVQMLSNLTYQTPSDIPQNNLEEYRIAYQKWEQLDKSLSEEIATKISNLNHFQPETEFESDELKKDKHAFKTAKQKIILLGKRLLKESISQTTYSGEGLRSGLDRWITKLPCKSKEKETIRAQFQPDGFIFRQENLIWDDVYGADIYVVQNVSKLKIESYKPYQSNEWIPTHLFSLNERLNRFRANGIER